MVSHFIVRTNICIPESIVDDFNKWIEELDISSCDELVPEFYDRILGDPLTILSQFTSGNNNHHIRHLKDVVHKNGWAAKSDGQLYVRLKPFHGAVSMMSYIIDTFFKPRDILLDGFIIGINPVYDMLYIYIVDDNKIKLHSESTYEFTLEYQSIRNNSDACESMFRILCDEMDLELNY